MKWWEPINLLAYFETTSYFYIKLGVGLGEWFEIQILVYNIYFTQLG